MFGGADALQPRTGRREFRLQRDIDEIAGDGDVVGPLRPQVRNQRVQHLAAMNFVTVARPVQIPVARLPMSSRKLRRRQRRKMRIGQMRQRECGH